MCCLTLNNGSISDGGIFQWCSLLQRPQNNMLPNGGFIVGDDAFPLKPFLIKPHSGMNSSYEEKLTVDCLEVGKLWKMSLGF